MDIEWGKTAATASSTSCRRARDGEEPGRGKAEQRYKLKGAKSTVLAEGRAIGQKIGTGPVRIVHSRPRWTACSRATCWSPT